MWIAEIYNHEHLFCKIPTEVRALYWAPAMVLALFSGSPYFNLLLFAGFNLCILFASRIWLSNLLKLYRIPFAFLIFGCATIALTVHSSNPFFGFHQLTIGFSSEGIGLAILIFTRSLALTSIMYFILLTHTISEIAGLMNRCKVPALLTDLFVVTFKFIENLRHDSMAMYRAQKCRLGYAGKSGKLALFANLMTTVFQHALAKAKQLETAMDARCAQTNYRFLQDEKAFIPAQLFIPAALTFISVCTLLICRKYGW